MQKKILFLTLVMILLAGCLPAQTAQDVSSQVNTAVAGTMQSQAEIEQMVQQTMFAQQSLFTPTAESSATPQPTFESVVIFTDTPFPSATPFPTNTFAPAAPVVQQAYDCFVETRSPVYLEEIKAGGNFEIKWFVRNTGTNAWASGVDIKYGSGPQMTTSERVEISTALNPGEVYKITLNAKAPNKSGTHTMTWIVEGQLCYANVTITVK
jgi:outer membrane murein-binding lipoprotein Lpp